MNGESVLGWHGPVLAFGVALLTCCGKAISPQQNFDDLHVRDIVWDRRARKARHSESGFRVVPGRSAARLKGWSTYSAPVHRYNSLVRVSL